MVEFDGFDAGGGAGGKLVKNSSKSRKLLKSPESLKGLNNLQRPSVRRNVHRSTDLPSIRYKELELLLKF